MNRQPMVLGLGGSTRKGSWAELLLRKALLTARDAGMKPQMYSLGSKDLPVFRDSHLTDPPPEVAELLAKVRQADAVVFSSPVYHGTIAGALKNAVDHLQALGQDEQPWLTGKVAGLMAVGGTPIGGANAISAMDHFCRALRVTTVPTAVIAGQGFLAQDGSFSDETVGARVARMVEELGSHARILTGREAPGA
ncbi:NADPH-dependent FMN reductase [Streptomyces xanthophaeus]